MKMQNFHQKVQFGDGVGQQGAGYTELVRTAPPEERDGNARLTAEDVLTPSDRADERRGRQKPEPRETRRTRPAGHGPDGQMEGRPGSPEFRTPVRPFGEKCVRVLWTTPQLPREAPHRSQEFPHKTRHVCKKGRKKPPVGGNRVGCATGSISPKRPCAELRK